MQNYVIVMYIKDLLHTNRVVRFKKIYLIEEKLNIRLEQLKQRLVKRGFKEDHVDSETERVNCKIDFVSTVSFQ